MEKIVVVIPYVDKEQAEKAKHIHTIRAGIPCEVIIVEDKDKIGWVAMHNKMSKELEYDYYVYSCSDYFPSRNYLFKAYELLRHSYKGMLGFNDGKWEGKNATAGMLKKEYLKSNYDGEWLFYPGYKMYGADPDLTEKTILQLQYIYDPSIVLMEIDYNKVGGSGSKEDTALFLKRKARDFPRR